MLWGSTLGIFQWVHAFCLSRIIEVNYDCAIILFVYRASLLRRNERTELAHSKTLCIELHMLERPVSLCWPVLQPASRQEQSIHIVENLKYLLCNKYSELSQIHLVYGHMRATIAFPESLVFLYVLFIYHTPLFSTPPKKILPSIPLPSSCAASIYREKKKEKETYVAQARLLRSIMYADETVSRRFQYLGHSPHRRHFSI